MKDIMIKMKLKFMINKVTLEINLNTILKLKKQIIKIFYQKSLRNLKEHHPQNIGINLKLMNTKLIKIFHKKIIYLKYKSKEVNLKFLQIQIKSKWTLGFQEYKKHQRNIKKFLYHLMTMLLTKIQKVQAVNKGVKLCLKIFWILWILYKGKYINKKVKSLPLVIRKVNTPLKIKTAEKFRTSLRTNTRKPPLMI